MNYPSDLSQQYAVYTRDDIKEHNNTKNTFVSFLFYSSYAIKILQVSLSFRTVAARLPWLLCVCTQCSK